MAAPGISEFPGIFLVHLMIGRKILFQILGALFFADSRDSRDGHVQKSKPRCPDVPFSTG